MHLKYITRAVCALLTFFVLEACTTIPVDEREQIRKEVNQVAKETISQLVEEDAVLQGMLDSSVGYAVARISTTKLPVVGGGYGLALLHDKESATNTYLNVTRFDLGAGLGAGRYRALVLFENQDALGKFSNGSWQQAVGTESAAGTQSSGRLSTRGEGYSVHLVSESGAALTVTARLIKTSVNRDLTDTGASEVSIPNTGFKSVGEQGEDAPRVWDHKLPFFAQKVIDKGYDLPLPYGIGVTYATVDQDQILTDLEVGINGSEIIPFDFVSFDNASSESNSYSIKANAWLLPFMNVFAMIGKLDGNAPMDVVLDGNGMLDHLDISCTGFPPSPLCAVLEDRSFVLPINAKFEGTTYGIGAIFAGGWNNWFVALPFNYTYADMKGSSTDGASFTATPRFGKVFNLGRKGNLALFVGGNYLDTDLTVDGIAGTPGDELVFDYIIDQQNKDNWNALLGFNWDINKRFSWSAEYDGFIGSREAFITSINWKF